VIVVDSSVWVEALRRSDSEEARVLSSLLDDDLVALAAPVRLELLLGATRRQGPRLRKLLSALPCWVPVLEDWKQAEFWVEPALRAGQRFGFADLLIAAIAHCHQASLWSNDRDFLRMESLGMVELYRPQGS